MNETCANLSVPDDLAIKNLVINGGKSYAMNPCPGGRLLFLRPGCPALNIDSFYYLNGGQYLIKNSGQFF